MTQAFTIVELLVVITIIVVLLALLAPVLDKAIFAMDDTSVRRYGSVTWDEAEATGRKRMVKVPSYNDGTTGWPTTWNHLPKE